MSQTPEWAMCAAQEISAVAYNMAIEYDRQLTIPSCDRMAEIIYSEFKDKRSNEAHTCSCRHEEKQESGRIINDRTA